MNLEQYFQKFRNNIVGNNQHYETPFGKQKLLYADWVASARFYEPIEEKIRSHISPFVANTHTESTITGTTMTKAYFESKNIIKQHVNASKTDKIIFCGSGMTGAIAKLQRILGMKVSERFSTYLEGVTPLQGFRELQKRSNDLDEKYHFKKNHKPIVFVTHMEHHSNHTSWLETIADVEIIDANQDGLVCLKHFKSLCEKHTNRIYKIASVTACSNVTGIEVPYHDIAKIIHQYNGLCFVDFAASAPYITMDMHPQDADQYLDAIFFSPHKFLGGPGTPGVLIFNESLYNNRCPDIPGGGTVQFTSPWYMHDYIDDIETREDGGTPPFIQGIRAAMVVRLKESMGVQNIIDRKNELMEIAFHELSKIPEVTILAGNIKKRHGVLSILIDDLHYNLVAKIFNDKYGIQVRGGCVCAGTYGHYLLDLDQKASNSIRKSVLEGDNTHKPGFLRISIHPTLTNSELYYILNSLKEIIDNREEWTNLYQYLPHNNEFIHLEDDQNNVNQEIDRIFAFND